MPVSVVVGGQYGSEGKGKVAHHVASERNAAAVIRVGGPNSGHTSIAASGQREVMQQLPMGALLDEVCCLIGPGSYIEPEILLAEVDRLGLDEARLCIDYRAFVIAESDRVVEREANLGERIGSTGSGTGAAAMRRIARLASDSLAYHCDRLRPFVGDAVAAARDLVAGGGRVVVEGTQGFGLSLLHSPHYPYVTSRDTSAAAALAEAGLSPLDVDDVTLVLRSFPIRVAGASGPFDAEEITWETIAREAGLAEPPQELTSVTHRVRRVARFDPEIVRKSIAVNNPSRVVLNHLDHVDASCASGQITNRARDFVRHIEVAINRHIDLLGFGPQPDDLLSLGQNADQFSVS